MLRGAPQAQDAVAMESVRVRTGYSFRNSAGKLPEVIQALKDVGAEYAPITDRASTFGYYRWTGMATAAGLKPVLGVELDVTEDAQESRPGGIPWVFLAKDSIQPINELIELATTQFRYRPLLTKEQALAREDVNIVVGPGQVLASKQLKERENVYYALGPGMTNQQAQQAKEHPERCAAAYNNNFPRAEDRAYYELCVGRRNSNANTYPQHILNEEEWRASIQHLGFAEEHYAAAKTNTSAVLGAYSAELQRAELPIPVRPDTLKGLCLAGAEALGVRLGRADGVYRKRLERELALIEQKGYEDYFYIVADICQWARRRMAVGPARGSSCGSLVCYLLGITTVDPIPFGLIFERFIDINRNDMPDIDIDFSDQQRYAVQEYISETYGAEHVARIGTVTNYRPRSALQEIGMALEIPRWKCDAVAESIIERSSADARAQQTLEDTFENMPAGKELAEEYPEVVMASRLEGHPRHYSQHAAGIVIAREPIRKYVAIDHRTGATMCDKKDAEDGYNLLKVDVLGLTQLSVLEDTLELAGLPRNHLETIPLDDSKAFQVLNRQRWSGIFQFNGLALQSLTKQVVVDSFEDIVAITALARPGPLAGGGALRWVWRRTGKEPVTYWHPMFEDILKDTYGVVLYQEQVMRIGREIGDLTWEQVTALRKAMSKSLGVEFFNQFGDPWKAAALRKGVGEAHVQKIWDELCNYGSWSFNKSHSVAYGLISYQCCWLKAHYPMEFAAATLTHQPEPERQIRLLREMVAEGYEYLPIDASMSGMKWSVGTHNRRKKLIGPLTNVVGIGPRIAQGILNARAMQTRLPDRAAKLLESPTTPIDSLWPIKDAFNRLLPDPTTRRIFTKPVNIIDIQLRDYDYEVVVFCVLNTINPRDEHEAVRIARRGGKMITDGKTASLNLQLRDDTDIVFGKITRHDYERLGAPIVARGAPNKALYAIKGTVKGDWTFRMVLIKAVKYIGDIRSGAVGGSKGQDT